MADAPSPTASCPSEQELADLVDGSLPPEGRARIVRHVDDCEDCAILLAEVGRTYLPAGIPGSEVVTKVASSYSFASGQVVGSRFEIIRPLGRGGMGEVFLARDGELGEPVALKTISPSLSADPRVLERFKREVRLARRVTHANVCRVLEFGRHQTPDGVEQSFFTMQYLSGRTLRQYLAQGPLGLVTTLDIARQLALGLAAIHDQEVVHRDIKPDNVILTGGSGDALRAHWLDFGVARADLLQSTANGTIAGTLDYLAPELFTGQSASPASDIYAFGLVLYELLTGDLPFNRYGGLARLDRRDSLDAPPPSTKRDGISRQLDSLVLACLSPTPRERPASAHFIEAALSACQGSGTAEDSRAPRAARSNNRRRLHQLGVTVASALAAAGLAGVQITRGKPPASALTAAAPAAAASDAPWTERPSGQIMPEPTPTSLRPRATSSKSLRSMIVPSSSPRAQPSVSTPPSVAPDLGIPDFGGRR